MPSHAQASGVPDGAEILYHPLHTASRDLPVAAELSQITLSCMQQGISEARKLLLDAPATCL